MLVRRRTLALAVLALLLLNALVLRALSMSRTFSLSVWSVGGGEVVLLQSPGDRVLLINTGPDASVLRLLGSALPFWERRIDGLVFTEVSLSYAGGAAEVLERYRVAEVLRSKTQGNASAERALADARSRSLSRGMRLILGKGAYADVLWPPSQSPNHPVLLRISSGNASALVGELPPREIARERELDAGLPAPTLRIASTTSGKFVLERRGFVRK